MNFLILDLISYSCLIFAGCVHCFYRLDCLLTLLCRPLPVLRFDLPVCFVLTRQTLIPPLLLFCLYLPRLGRLPRRSFAGSFRMVLFFRFLYYVCLYKLNSVKSFSVIILIFLKPLDKCAFNVYNI